jgi:hypothetical protein
MTTSRMGRRALLSQLGPAALLGAGAAVGFWLCSAPGGRGQVLLAFAVLATTVVLGIVWEYRAQAARRWSAAVDAYADQEMARARLRRLALVRTAPGRGSVLPNHRDVRPRPPQPSDKERES